MLDLEAAIDQGIWQVLKEQVMVEAKMLEEVKKEVKLKSSVIGKGRKILQSNLPVHFVPLLLPDGRVNITTTCGFIQLVRCVTRILRVRNNCTAT